MIDNEKLDETLLELGHDDFVRGTALLREAVRRWDVREHPYMTKELYPALAREFGSTPSRVERSMRHTIEKAWLRGDSCLQRRIFGAAYSPDKGMPTNGGYIAGLARFCEVGRDNRISVAERSRERS